MTIININFNGTSYGDGGPRKHESQLAEIALQDLIKDFFSQCCLLSAHDWYRSFLYPRVIPNPTSCSFFQGLVLSTCSLFAMVLFFVSRWSLCTFPRWVVTCFSQTSPAGCLDPATVIICHHPSLFLDIFLGRLYIMRHRVLEFYQYIYYKREMALSWNPAKVGGDGKDLWIISNLYWHVRLRNYKLTEEFEIRKGVHQGCILSPMIFNLYVEQVFSEALHDIQIDIKINGRAV